MFSAGAGVFLPEPEVKKPEFAQHYNRGYEVYSPVLLGHLCSIYNKFVEKRASKYENINICFT